MIIMDVVPEVDREKREGFKWGVGRIYSRYAILTPSYGISK